MTSSPTWSTGETPFGDYPEAESPPRVLYGVHDGGIPGTGHPTNRGVDPYVATRGEDGWFTTYVGIPANDPRHQALLLDPRGADSEPRNLRLRRLKAARPALAKAGFKPASRFTSQTAPWCRAWPRSVQPRSRHPRRLHRQGLLRQRLPLHLRLHLPVCQTATKRRRLDL